MESDNKRSIGEVEEEETSSNKKAKEFVEEMEVEEKVEETKEVEVEEGEEEEEEEEGNNRTSLSFEKNAQGDNVIAWLGIKTVLIELQKSPMTNKYFLPSKSLLFKQAIVVIECSDPRLPRRNYIFVCNQMDNFVHNLLTFLSKIDVEDDDSHDYNYFVDILLRLMNNGYPYFLEAPLNGGLPEYKEDGLPLYSKFVKDGKLEEKLQKMVADLRWSEWFDYKTLTEAFDICKGSFSICHSFKFFNELSDSGKYFVNIFPYIAS